MAKKSTSSNTLEPYRLVAGQRITPDDIDRFYAIPVSKRTLFITFWAKFIQGVDIYKDDRDITLMHLLNVCIASFHADVTDFELRAEGVLFHVELPDCVKISDFRYHVRRVFQDTLGNNVLNSAFGGGFDMLDGPSLDWTDFN